MSCGILTIIDLDTDGDFQGQDPDFFAEKLVGKGQLPRSIKKIVFVVS